MINKDEIAASMARECDIAKHLHSKLKPESYSYKPTEGQRTTIELLRYLTICGIAGIQSLDKSDWQTFSIYTARAKEMTAEGFPAAMDLQKKEIFEFFKSVTEHTLETKDAKLPIGGTQALGQAILDLPFKWLAAYKLQLFLYAKATGTAEIGTANAWMGIDWKPPAK